MSSKPPQQPPADVRPLAPAEYEDAKRAALRGASRDSQRATTPRKPGAAVQMTADEYSAAKKALIRGA